MNVDQLNTENWMLRFRNGDESALKVLYDLFGTSLFFFANSFVRNREEAEDIVENIFIKAWKQRATFADPSNIKAFLYVATKNECLNFLKHTRRKISSHKELAYLKNQSHEEFINKIIYSDLLRLLSEEVEKLPVLARLIFKLTFIEGLSPAEIAQQLNMPVQNVRNNKSRALQLLRLSLDKRILSVS